MVFLTFFIRLRLLKKWAVGMTVFTLGLLFLLSLLMFSLPL